jgi:hypothetical protein
MIKRSIQQDIMIINAYEPNAGTYKFIKQTFLNLKGEIGSNTKNTLFSSMTDSPDQKKESARKHTNGPKKHFQLKIVLSFHQHIEHSLNRSYFRPQNKFQQIQRN